MRIPVPTEILPADQLGRVHFVGIGGAGLSGIARLMHQQGVVVSGSDAKESAVVTALRAEGLTVHVGHDGSQVAGVDTVIATTAAREDNPEIMAALEQGLRLWPRSAGLQSVLLGKRVVAVGGTHGKTTTTTMLTVALQEAGLDPTFVIGAEVESLGTNARLGAGDVAVVEADESDGAFLVYTPEIAVVTNVDADHLDHWSTPAAYAAAFSQFVAGASSMAVVNADDAGAALLAGEAERVMTVGFTDGADLQGSDLTAAGGGVSFDARHGDQQFGTVALSVPGRHYAQDALLALGAGLALGADAAALIRGLARHRGAKRRMELIGEAAGVRVYDSYAHHPSEIRGDLEAARSLVGGTGRLVVCFQPHLVSRTRIFGVEMGEALGAADHVAVLDVFVAREDPDPEVTGALVADAVPLPPDQVGFVSDRGAAIGVLMDVVESGDVLLTLGAGDVTTLAPEFLAALSVRGDAQP